MKTLEEVVMEAVEADGSLSEEQMTTRLRELPQWAWDCAKSITDDFELAGPERDRLKMHIASVVTLAANAGIKFARQGS